MRRTGLRRAALTGLESTIPCPLRDMNSKALFPFLLWLAGSTALAQSQLPPCPTDPNVRWHACQGRYAWTNGDVYTGEWRDDKPHGRGTYTSPDGERHVGEWREGKRHGPGITYAPDGSIRQSGRWAEDRWVQALLPDTARQRRPEAEQRSSGEGEGGSSGTGFSVTPGFVVTNEHVVSGCRRVEVHSADGRRAGAVVDTDDLVDLALVRVTGLGGSTVPLRRPGSVRLGEAAYAFGFPLSGLLSNGGNFTNGVVSGLRGLRDSANEIQITTPVQPGNSGGAVIDASGQVIGVVVSKLNASAVARATGGITQNVNFAVSLSALADFLRRNSFTLEPPATAGCRYDVFVKYRSGETEERRDQDFCTLVELKFRGRGR